MSKRATVLLVTSFPERARTLQRELEDFASEILTATNCREVHQLLRTRPLVDVVVTDVSHSDGNWCDVLRHAVQTGVDAGVLVSTSLADETLWSEVLCRGGYDVLVEPYDSAELRRVFEGALRASTKLEDASLLELPLPIATAIAASDLERITRTI